MIDLSTIETAAATIAKYIEPTPLRSSPYFSEMSGFDVSMKFENWQPTGSFKVRGALNNLLSLPVRERLHGVVAWSAGNHALGVAYAANILEVPATIFVPAKTPRTKLRKLRYFPVAVRTAETYEECERQGRAFAEKEGMNIIHPYDDWRTVAGQGTIGLEIHLAMPELDAVVVPVGGGGLISGVAIALKSLDPDIRLIAVQTAESPSLWKSLQDKICYEEFPAGNSIAEGIAGGIGRIVYSLAPSMIDELVLVDEEEIKMCIARLLEFEGQVIEASGAAAVAALQHIDSVPRGSRIAAILTGGNIDIALLRSLI